MEERLQLRWRIKIAGLSPEEKIAEKRCAGGQMSLQFAIFHLYEEKPPGDPARSQDNRQRRKDPADAPRIEIGKGKRAACELIEDDPGNEETGDHEEDVDANEAAGDESGGSMKANHCEHGDGPQPIEIRSIRESGEAGR
jgi:hypothetical protein